MKKYIDCDGVIVDTETGLFDNYYIMKKENPELKKTIYLQNIDWETWINKAEVLNDAINILKSYNPEEADILTKINSYQEMIAKVTYFREKKVKNNIIFVPHMFQKSSIVTAKGNVLVDDSNKNLDNWDKANGYSLYFGDKDSTYPKVESLEDILDNKRLIKFLKR